MKTSIKMSLALGFATLAGLTPNVEASPVQFGANYYEFVSVADPFTGGNNSWFTDAAAASASIFGGVNGHLATITSQAENDFLFSLATGQFTGFAGAWIGGKSPEGWLVGPETGQAFTYINWGGVEPNNSGYAYMQIGTSGPAAQGKWLDDSGAQGFPDSSADPVVGYFIEYERPTTVPDSGATLVLLGLSFAGLAVGRRLLPAQVTMSSVVG
jgi:hypothetical protein